MQDVPEYKNYLVSWEIEVSAPDAESAAREALNVQRDPASTAAVFKVFGPGTTDEVDLMADDEESVGERERTGSSG